MKCAAMANRSVAKRGAGGYPPKPDLDFGNNRKALAARLVAARQQTTARAQNITGPRVAASRAMPAQCSKHSKPRRNPRYRLPTPHSTAPGFDTA
jgi:hypothetical protein